MTSDPDERTRPEEPGRLLLPELRAAAGELDRPAALLAAEARATFGRLNSRAFDAQAAEWLALLRRVNWDAMGALQAEAETVAQAVAQHWTPRHRARLAYLLLEELRSEPGDAHRSLVAEALAAEGKSDPRAAECLPAEGRLLVPDGCDGWAEEHKGGGVARDKLARAVQAAARSLARHLTEHAAPWPPATDEEATREGEGTGAGMLLWDAAAADWLERGGPDGRWTATALAESIREEARARWSPPPELPGIEPHAAGLWAGWDWPGGLWLRLGRLAWRCEVGAWWEAERARLTEREKQTQGTPAAAAQLILNLRSFGPRRPVTRTYRDRDAGRDIAVLARDYGGPEAWLDLAGLPVAVAERLLRGELRDLRGKAGIGVLNELMNAHAAALLAEPEAPWHNAIPALLIPRGVSLAERIGMPSKGEAARAVDEAVWAWSAVEIRTPGGGLVRFIHRPEARPAAPGRPSAWKVTPGELLHPAGILNDAKHLASMKKLVKADRPWRRLMPWPDELAPDYWPEAHNQRGAASFAALALVLSWTEATSADYGKTWADAPGVVLDDDGWRELCGRMHAPELQGQRGRALDAWRAADWIGLDGDRVTPGKKLPRLAAALNKGAKSAGKKKKR